MPRPGRVCAFGIAGVCFVLFFFLLLSPTQSNIETNNTRGLQVGGAMSSDPNDRGMSVAGVFACRSPHRPYPPLSLLSLPPKWRLCRRQVSRGRTSSTASPSRWSGCRPTTSTSSSGTCPTRMRPSRTASAVRLPPPPSNFCVLPKGGLFAVGGVAPT